MTPTTSVYHQPDPGPDGLCRVPGCGRPRISHIAPDPAPADDPVVLTAVAAYGRAVLGETPTETWGATPDEQDDDWADEEDR